MTLDSTSLDSAHASLDSCAMSNSKKERRFGEKLTRNHELIKKGLENAESLDSLSRRCSVHRHTIADYVHSHEDLQKAYEDGQDALADRYEDELHRIALSGSDAMTSLNAIKFYLERRARRRGYGIDFIEPSEKCKPPVIIVNTPSEDEIAKTEAMIKEMNDAVAKELVGINRV